MDLELETKIGLKVFVLDVCSSPSSHNLLPITNNIHEHKVLYFEGYTIEDVQKQFKSQYSIDNTNFSVQVIAEIPVKELLKSLSRKQIQKEMGIEFPTLLVTPKRFREAKEDFLNNLELTCDRFVETSDKLLLKEIIQRAKIRSI